MDKEGCVPVNKEYRRTQYSTVQNVKDNPYGKSVCSSVVDLTDDAWLLVLSYLGTADRIRVARVSTRWRELSKISWKSITRLSFEDKLFIRRSDLPEVCLQQCGTRLQCLDLSAFCYRATPRLLYLVGLHGASLQELNLYNSGVDNTALKTLAKKLPRLTSLNLSRCLSVGEDGLRSVLKMLQSLQSLNVSYNSQVTGEFFSQAPLSLTEVRAQECWNLTDEGVRVLAERCPNLEKFNDIRGCDNLTVQSIRHLAENCPKLKRLMINCEYFQWDDSTIVTLFNLPLLEEFIVSRYPAMSDQVFHGLSRHCPRLTAISLWHCRNLTDDAFFHLCPWLNLESIELGYCTQITDRGLIQLSSTHSQLNKVMLISCDDITDRGVGHLVSVDHPNLLKLEVSGCPHVTDGVLPKLESSLQHRELTHGRPLSIMVQHF